MYSICIAFIYGLSHALSASQYIFYFLVDNVHITQRTTQAAVRRSYHFLDKDNAVFHQRDLRILTIGQGHTARMYRLRIELWAFCHEVNSESDSFC